MSSDVSASVVGAAIKFSRSIYYRIGVITWEGFAVELSAHSIPQNGTMTFAAAFDVFDGCYPCSVPKAKYPAHLLGTEWSGKFAFGVGRLATCSYFWWTVIGIELSPIINLALVIHLRLLGHSFILIYQYPGVR